MTYHTKAELFKILSHPVRLQILDELRKREACVCHLQAVTGRPQAYISQQLRVLKDADLVVDEKEGQNVYYHLRNDEVRHLMQETLGEAEAPAHPRDCNCPFCTQ
jgi:DNA-binding transcriptional ArsR family regulator